ncbi:DUF1622 domain-containing protein [Myxococcus sp. RHSTA-1-4]|uniref:DUF1622 domain-containing protein n=1 Tax=Myxococcus sp. RHSTA-1-4 TaxID=2874601 RepID=UPI001CBD9BC4|nr:DUF1622 domain-containing protein [Myxococcus sp. RHSTA-1-4]MBZ4416147.1 DUF1622 domain-containing protein [Myxococcus sp. RHSTA-1-4]
MEADSLIELSAHLMEWAGVGSMVLGALLAAVLLAVRRGLGPSEAYRRFRLNLGRAILLGLEFLVAADILRTVSEEPTMRGVLVLGLIVLIRTFLSFTLTVELEGRWPWQHRETSSETVHRPPPPPSRPPHAPPGEEHAVPH